MDEAGVLGTWGSGESGPIQLLSAGSLSPDLVQRLSKFDEQRYYMNHKPSKRSQFVYKPSEIKASY